METSKKASIILLSAVNIINFLAGVVTQFTLSAGKSVYSVIPIKADISDVLILMINFSVVVAVIFFICLILSYLTFDVPYSVFEIFSEPSPLFYIPSLAVSIWGIVNAFCVGDGTEIFVIILSSLLFFAASAVDVALLITVKLDSAE